MAPKPVKGKKKVKERSTEDKILSIITDELTGTSVRVMKRIFSEIPEGELKKGILGIVNDLVDLFEHLPEMLGPEIMGDLKKILTKLEKRKIELKRG